jgi:ABC-type phosphate transport system substrate-binding protein
MKAQHRGYVRAACALALCCVLALAGSLAALKNIAVIVAADSNLPDLTMAELAKMCKGAQKTWPNGRNFTLILKDPSSPEMHGVVQKLIGAPPAEAKTAIAKINENHQTIRVVDSEEDVFRAVASTPGAVGLVDVYSITSAVKVLHIDGKLPFDVGYALR